MSNQKIIASKIHKKSKISRRFSNGEYRARVLRLRQGRNTPILWERQDPQEYFLLDGWVLEMDGGL